MRLLPTQLASQYLRVTPARIHQLATDGVLTRYGTERRRLWDLTELASIARFPAAA